MNFAKSRASAASRPSTSTETGSLAGPDATKRASPQTWRRASCRPVTWTPTSNSASSTWCRVGVAAGVPKMRFIAAATPHPSATLPATSMGRPVIDRTAPVTPTISAACTVRRVGRRRNGVMTSSAAIVTASPTTG